MEIYEEKTSEFSLEGLTPAELAFICHALQQAVPNVKEHEIMYLGDDVRHSLYIGPEGAKELLKKIEVVCLRDEMICTMNVNPEITNVDP